MCKLLILEVNLDRWAAWHCSLAIRFSTATLLAWLFFFFFLALGKTNKYVHPWQTTGSFKKLWRARFSAVQNPSTVCSNQLQFVSATEQLPVYIYIYQVTICCWDSNLSTPVTNLSMLLLGVHWPVECLNSFRRNGTVFSRNIATRSLPNPEKNITLN